MTPYEEWLDAVDHRLLERGIYEGVDDNDETWDNFEYGVDPVYYADMIVAEINDMF